MSERPDPDAHELDDQIAAYTDRLIDQGLQDKTGDIQDDKTSDYYPLLARLNKLASNEDPDRAMAKRIRSRLESEWKSANPKLVSAKPEQKASKFRSLSGYKSARQRQNYSLRLAFATIALVILLAFFITPTINHAFPGAAGSQVDIIIFLGMIILFLGFATWWFFHRKG